MSQLVEVVKSFFTIHEIVISYFEDDFISFFADHKHVLDTLTRNRSHFIFVVRVLNVQFNAQGSYRKFKALVLAFEIKFLIKRFTALLFKPFLKIQRYRLPLLVPPLLMLCAVYRIHS